MINVVCVFSFLKGETWAGSSQLSLSLAKFPFLLQLPLHLHFGYVTLMIVVQSYSGAETPASYFTIKKADWIQPNMFRN